MGGDEGLRAGDTCPKTPDYLLNCVIPVKLTCKLA